MAKPHTSARAIALRRAFIAAYLADPARNATQAAIAAGYSKRSARPAACGLLKDAEVQAAIAAVMRPRMRRVGLTQERVANELAIVCQTDVNEYRLAENGDITLPPNVPPRMTRGLSSVKRRTRTETRNGQPVTTHEVEFRVHDKVRGLGLAMKHLGMLTDRVEVRVTEPQTWKVGDLTITF